MLTYSSNLSTALLSDIPEVFLLLKLYFNNEGSITYLSDKDRTVNSNEYMGLVKTWGNYSQSLDFFNYTTSTGNMTVTINNSPNTIEGGRFTDLFATNNYANRKWELFMTDAKNPGEDNMIATGIISGDIKYTPTTITFTLLDFSPRYHKRLPVNLVNTTDHTNAPAANLGKPLPIPFGDYQVQASVPTDTFDQHYVKSKFPAIITDKWNQSGEYVFATADNAAIHTMDTENVFMSKGSSFLNCDSGDINIAANPTIKFRGADWYYYTLLSAETGAENGSDGDFDTEYAATVGGDPWTLTWHFGIPKIPKLGVVNQIRVLIYWKFTGDVPVPAAGAGFYGYLKPQGGAAYVFQTGWDPGAGGGAFYVSKYVIPFDGAANTYTADEADEVDLEGDIYFVIVDDDATGKNETATVTIQEIGFEVQFAPDQGFEKTFEEFYEARRRTGISPQRAYYEGGALWETVISSRTVTELTPAVGEYIYYSGKGRKYGAWIDTIDGNARTDENGASADPGYASGDLIENPVYIIEEILRTELGLDSGVDGSDIDLVTFDEVGNNTNGIVFDALNISAANTEFAFCQHKFIHSQDLIEKICSQIGSWVWISGDGKFKITSRRRFDDYSSADKTINFKEIDLLGISQTPLNAVRNDITVNYGYDYGQEQNLLIANPSTNPDTTSNGTTVDGYKQTLNLDVDADHTYNSLTAIGIAEMYQAFMKQRHPMIKFTTKHPKYNDLEIGDIIQFSNWPSDIKLYGTALSASTDYFMVQKISKNVINATITVIRVGWA